MRRFLPIAALIFATAAVAATTAPDAPSDHDRTAALAQYQRDLISILVLRSDATHLLGAALLARPLHDLREGTDASSLLRRAGKAEDSGPAVSWIELGECGKEDSPCPNPEALAKLHRQAPDNAAVWLLDLAGAARDHDDAGVRKALAGAAAASRYDDYAGAALQALVAAATALPVPPDALAAYAGNTDAGPASAQAFLALGLAALHPRPGLLPLVALCAPGHEDDATLREPCLKLARTLAWGSSPQARAAGLHIRSQLTDDDAERAAIDAGLRDLAWQVRNYSRLALRALTDQGLAVELLRLAQHGGSEASLMSAMLHKNGIPLEAPPDTAAAAASGADAPADAGTPPPAASAAAADEPSDTPAPAPVADPAPAVSAG